MTRRDRTAPDRTKRLADLDWIAPSGTRSHPATRPFPELQNQGSRGTRTDLLVYLLRRSTNPEDAADVLAQVFVIAWQKIDGVPAGDHARPWLFGVARNLLSKAWSRERSEEALAHRLASELREAICPVYSAEAAATAVRQALMSLPKIDREIVMLTAWDGLTPHQIAVVIGRSPNVVRVRLHRARARLRRGLGPLVAVESGLAVESIGHER